MLFNRRAEKGNANYDVRQRFVTSYAYELPVGKGKRFMNTAAWLMRCSAAGS